MISFDSSFLTSYYNAKSGVSGGASGGSGLVLGKTTSPTGKAEAPRTPWGTGSGMMDDKALVKNVLAGHRFINQNAAVSDVIGASADYTKLFTLYQGLNALEGLAQKAQDSTLSDLTLAAVRRRFQTGMGEVQNYVKDTKFDHISLTEGTLTEKLKNEVGVGRTNSVYTGPGIHTGSATSSVKAFEGDVKFSIAVKKIGSATPFNVDIDLADMSGTRSMSNVVGYINSKLKEQGLATKFIVNRTPAVAETQVVNGKTITLSKGVDSYGLKIQGVSYEDLTMSAPTTADAVYVVQTTGDPEKKTVVKDDAGKTKKGEDGKPVTEVGKDVSSQLVKFQADEGDLVADPSSKVGTKFWVEGQEANVALSPNITSVRQTVSGADGSVYVLADVEGDINDQAIKGKQDVALIKYDSAGKVVFTRTLGASDTASGYAMSVSDDGRVALAGSVTGALNISKTETKTYGTGEKATTATLTTNVSTNGVNESLSDSFVTVFDKYGVEEWTQRRGATQEDQATSVAFGDDGAVYVGGKTKSLVPGAASGAAGGYDGYIMGFSKTGDARFSVQTGTANSDTTSQLVVDGDTVYAASIEDGNAVVRSYDVSSNTTTTDGKTTTTWAADVANTRNLGGIGGGNITGFSLIDGKIYLGGSTGNGKLMETTANVTKAYSGGQDAFALSIDADLTNTSDDKLAYYGGAGIEKDAQVKFADDGKAWIAGNTDGEIAGTAVTSTRKGVRDAFLAKLDVENGDVEFQKRYTGQDGVVSPNAIAISKGGSSVLDRMGLPQGAIMQKDLGVDVKGKIEANTRIVSSTAVRTGDQFYMVDPSSGARKTITIDADETLESLSKKIVRGSGYRLKVDIMKMTGEPLSQLNIQPSNKSSKMEFVAGPSGRDALEGLGLAPGIVSADANKVMDAKASNYTKTQKMMGLEFDGSLNLATEANVKSALESLKGVMKNVQKAYNYLKYGDPQETDSKKKGKSSGQAPAYLTNQINNYQAALNRLTGGG
ncbi:regulatory protein FlaEY [Asticcacaulis biprosthecium C19]|uniref:Regulatory protein FlaEY n=1 Tax=Asticcacaulis biprosthecium C19 TaxID=715226 RepID=F4QR93_9CAUL|nr:hypothetical protein [Asticcacaulis biprosthecium]EGF90730.1 regulatory protein FlaEY [Asticcacaulis biprosthecium C19]